VPLVELGPQAKAEVAAALGRICDEHSDAMIGKIGAPTRADRKALVG
jgi:hypothetical protein